MKTDPPSIVLSILSITKHLSHVCLVDVEDDAADVAAEEDEDDADDDHGQVDLPPHRLPPPAVGEPSFIVYELSLTLQILHHLMPWWIL